MPKRKCHEASKERIQEMDRNKETPGRAAPAEPRQDRLLAVLLEGVLDLELAAARDRLEASSAPPPLVERALRLLRKGRVSEQFLVSPLKPDRHEGLLPVATHPVTKP